MDIRDGYGEPNALRRPADRTGGGAGERAGRPRLVGVAGQRAGEGGGGRRRVEHAIAGRFQGDVGPGRASGGHVRPSGESGAADGARRPAGHAGDTGYGGGRAEEPVQQVGVRIGEPGGSTAAGLRGEYPRTGRRNSAGDRNAGQGDAGDAGGGQPGPQRTHRESNAGGTPGTPGLTGVSCGRGIAGAQRYERIGEDRADAVQPCLSHLSNGGWHPCSRV